MEEALIHRIATEVVRQEILGNWLYWLVVLAVFVAGSFLANLIAAFATRKGELSATKAGFNDILKQLEKTTKATEDIRSAVSLGEWSKKEQTTLRRVKLEELLFAALEVKDWWHRERHRILFESGEKQTPSPMPRVHGLGRLYFPELKDKIAAFDVTFDQVHASLLMSGAEVTVAKMETSKYGDPRVTADVRTAALNAALPKLQEFYRPFAEALRALEISAAEIMESILAVR